jgi:hypothetical protein
MRSIKLSATYWDQYCSKIFQKDFVSIVKNSEDIEGGLINGRNIIFINGSEDPW